VRFKRQQLSLMLVLLALVAGRECQADTHYVSLSGTNNSPYTNWADAATDVTWAVTAAGVNDIVLVTNGVYYPTQRIYNASTITLRSVNGRDVTIINGANNTNNCADLAGSSVLDGFTVTNCNHTKFYGLLSIGTVRNCLFVNNTTKGGTVGVFPVSVTNCIFKNNSGSTLSGAIYSQSGAGATIAGCHFEGNYANAYGGACDMRSSQNIISNCVFINNRAKTYGGALFFDFHNTNSLVVNCTITSNVVAGGTIEGFGGGIYSEAGMAIKNCSLIGNIATNKGGGIYMGGWAIGTNTIIKNCLIARNSSVTNTAGGVYVYTNCNIESCTIVSNYAKVAGGGVYIDGPGSGGTNNIIYFNTATSEANFTNTAGNTGLNYSCVIPEVGGAGNITNDPRLIDLAGGNYRLRVNSPCVNAGTNQSWMTNAVDLDGIARIRYGIVDMGAYETVLRRGNIYRVR